MNPKAAYYRAAIETHPDVGGSAEAFKQACQEHGKSSREGKSYARHDCGYCFNELTGTDEQTCQCGFVGSLVHFSVWWRPNVPWKPKPKPKPRKKKGSHTPLLFKEATK